MGFEFYHSIGTPNIIATLVMLIWLPLVVWLFQSFPARRAIVISFIVAWLFLPVVSLTLPGIPNYTKVSATSYGILLATFIFDVNRFKKFKFGVLDIPILIWCIYPLFSSLSNDLGLYDAVSSVVDQTMSWGIPYLLGRIYLGDLSGLRQLAIGIFAGGLIYAPLCLLESRISPQLHNIFYGGHPHDDFAQTVRLGGYRPMVFMQHGLAVGAWMMAASLIGIWLWRSGAISKVFNLTLQFSVPFILITFLLLRSTGAYGLLVLGLILLLLGVALRNTVPVYLIIFSIIVYLSILTLTDAETYTHLTDRIVYYLSQYLPEDRVNSIEFRFNNEALLIERAQERFWLGWGGWGRNLLFDDQGNQITIPDSLWIITFGQYGFIGLINLYTIFLLPVVSVFSTKCHPYFWDHKKMAPVAALAITLLLYSIDCLVNDMNNPIYILICGGLTGYAMAQSRNLKRERSRLPLSSTSVSLGTME